MPILDMIKDFFGYVALTTTIIGLIPQVYKTHKTKSARDLSAIMIWNCLVCASSWLVYGIFIKDKMVIISNVLALFTSIILIIQKNKYDKEN